MQKTSVVLEKCSPLEGMAAARTLALEAKERWLEENLPKFKHLPPLAMAKEIKSIHLNFGRQTGNTEWVLQTAFGRLDSGSSLIMVMNEAFVRRTMLRLVPLWEEKEPSVWLEPHTGPSSIVWEQGGLVRRIDVHSWSGSADRLRGFAPRLVFFDASDMLPDRTRDNLLEILFSARMFLFC